MTLRTFVLGAVAALGFATAAPAATFDFTAATSIGPNGSGKWSDSLVYTSDGVTLTVTGGPTANNKSAWVKTWKDHGLGVCSGFEQPKCVTGDHQLDSFGVDEFVQLAFSTAVTLTKIVFNHVDGTDTYDLTVGGNLEINDGDLDNGWTAVENLTGDYTAKVFTIGAGTSSISFCEKYSYKNGKKTCVKTKVVKYDSAFKVASLTVDVPSKVPVPASGLLLAGGLALMATARRRRRAAA